MVNPGNRGSEQWRVVDLLFGAEWVRPATRGDLGDVGDTHSPIAVCS